MWQYDECLTQPLSFLSGVTNVGEELDLTDEEIEELIEINQEHGRREREKTSGTFGKIMSDAQKIEGKAITQALKEGDISGKE